jgi:hypothetical protein
MSNREVRKQLRGAIQRYGAEWLNERDAWLGNLSGVVETGTAGLLYARLANGDTVTVHNTAGVPSTFDLHVRIGENRHQRRIWQIIRVAEDYDTPASAGQIAHHHTQHEFPGSDTVWINRKQLTYFTALVSDGPNYIVTIYGGVTLTPNGIAVLDHQTVDLSSYAPVIGALYINIEVDDDLAVTVHAGDNFGSIVAADPSYVPVPAAGKYILAYILLYQGQTELADSDIVIPMPLNTLPRTLNNGIVLPYAAKTSTYAITETDYSVHCTTGTFTVTLPTAVGKSGQLFNIKNTGTGLITVDTTSSQLIDASLTITLAQYESVTVQSTNANWIIL